MYEVISNSIHAIEEIGNSKKGHIKIEIDREGHEGALFELSDVDQYSVKSFIITDDGIGFNERNYKSFLTAESEYKFEKGAKGIGRFICLKAFKKVDFESVYKNKDGKIELRSFTLKAYGRSIDDERINIQEEKLSSGTKVTLNTFFDEYKIHCPKSISEIGEKIIEHFFIFFIEDRCPSIELIDTNGSSIMLQDKFGKELLPNLIKKTFKVKNEEFNINLLKVEKAEGGHKVHYCGNCRDVVSDSLSRYIPDLLSNVFLLGNDNLYLKVYVTSTYLDADSSLKCNFLFLSELNG